jgi:ketosteroid isomerase-like protein
VDGDVDGVLAHASEDVQWHPSIWSSSGATYHGHDGLREWIGQFAHPHRRIQVRPKEFRQGPSAVAVVGEVAEYSGEMRTVTVSLGWVFEVADGKVTRGEGFSDPIHALRIAGIWD